MTFIDIGRNLVALLPAGTGHALLKEPDWFWLVGLRLSYWPNPVAVLFFLGESNGDGPLRLPMYPHCEVRPS